MLDRVRPPHVLSEFPSKDAISIRSSVLGPAARGTIAAVEPLACVRLISGGWSRTVEIGTTRAPAGRDSAPSRLLARASATAESWFNLERRRASPLLAAVGYGGAFGGAYSDRLGGPGECCELSAPLRESPFVLDATTIASRFYSRGSGDGAIKPAKRALSEERFWLRTPKGASPRDPSGLLVWVDAGPLGRPPRVFEPALDELGLVAIGAARSGNDRDPGDRAQLALDAVATARAIRHIDPRRVYIAGVSGGGRMASILAGCFPDVFTGCAPIVGMDAFVNVPDGGRGMWPAAYSKPQGPLLDQLRANRFAAITGRDDFNHANVTLTAASMQREGLSIRVFDYTDLGHEVPSAERIAEVLRWVDEPWRASRAREVAAADRALKEYLDDRPSPNPRDDTDRRALRHVTEVGPWTPAAWRAVELLDTSPPPSPSSGPGAHTPG
ncbi:MAG: hypothetical protein JNM07_00220 [Phycisphaerae bacterium]|nr:hypothetical protein [Phycisphaerae bacterium]